MKTGLHIYFGYIPKFLLTVIGKAGYILKELGGLLSLPKPGSGSVAGNVIYPVGTIWNSGIT
jgi:hypothetical protein